MNTYTTEQVEEILSKAQEAILCNIKDALMDVNYAREYFKSNYTHPYKEGQWLFVEGAESGARGANGAIGTVTKEKGCHGVESAYGDLGLRLKIGKSVWNIGRNYKVRPATNAEISLINASISASEPC